LYSFFQRRSAAEDQGPEDPEEKEERDGRDDLADSARRRILEDQRHLMRARVDGDTVQLTDNLSLDRQMRHDIEVVIDRLTIKGDIRPRLAEAVELALRLGKGNLVVALEEGTEKASGGRQSPVIVAPPDEAEPTEETDREAHTSRSPGKRRKRSAARESDILFSSSYACTHCGLCDAVTALGSGLLPM
jgi:excinuclease ABC subunit A